MNEGQHYTMRAYVPNQRQQLKLNNDIQSMKLFICNHFYFKVDLFQKSYTMVSNHLH